MVYRAKASMVAMGYSQVEGVDYFETFASTASATFNRLVAAMACKLDWDLRHLDVDQAFIQSGIGHRYLLASSPRLWISIWQGSSPQQGPLWPEAEWSSVVSAVVVNSGGVWFRAMLGRSLCISSDGCW